MNKFPGASDPRLIRLSSPGEFGLELMLQMPVQRPVGCLQWVVGSSECKFLGVASSFRCG